MHTRIGTFDVAVDRLDALVELFRGPVFDAFSRHDGFLGYRAFVDRGRGRMVGLSFWASLADLQASEETARAARAQAAALGALTIGEPQLLEQAFDEAAPRRVAAR